jgi:16S rRNA (uracil1498-N3)-methyltransferase
MRQSRVFVQQELGAGLRIDLDSTTSHYLKNVLRVSLDTKVVLFNGSGGEYQGAVVALGKSQVSIQLGSFEPIDRCSPVQIQLGLCITKREAMDTAVQMATELGVNQIQPLYSEHTHVARQAAAKRAGHWQQIVYSACEQCGLNRPPALRPVEELSAWLTQTDADLKLIADPSGQANLLNLSVTPTSIAVLIGPEGGFSAQELDDARQQGFIVVGLGPRILRAAHAPATVIGLLQARFGDLQHVGDLQHGLESNEVNLGLDIVHIGD